jgi:hypothetical protein
MSDGLELILRRLPKGETEDYYKYDVSMDGRVIVTASIDPEFAAARACGARLQRRSQLPA